MHSSAGQPALAQTRRERWLGRYLLGFGVFCCVGLSFPVPLFFGDWLLWQPRNLPTELMVSGLYFAMGLVMIAASRNPLAHQGLVDFLILGNLLHAVIMVVFGEHWRHVLLDAGTVGLLGGLPLLVYPWGLKHFLRYPRKTRR